MKVKYVNYRKEFPTLTNSTRWFSFDRYWSGKLIHVSVKHHCLIFDFRKNWLEDMARGVDRNEG